MDMSKYSDDELKRIINGDQQNDLSSMSNEELMGILGGNVPQRNPNASWIGTNLAKGWEVGREATGGLRRFLGDETGGQAMIKKAKQNQAQYELDMPSMETKDVTGLGTAIGFGVENVAKNAALILPTAAAATAATLAAPAIGLGGLGATALGALGGFAGSLPMETGIISAESDVVDGNRGRILAGAVPAASLDAISMGAMGKAIGLNKVATSAAKKFGYDMLTKDIVGAAPKIAQPLWKTAATTGAELVGAGIGEGMTEGAQSPLEKWGAGKPVFQPGKAYEDNIIGNTAAALSGGYLGSIENYTPEMQKEIKESAWGGAAAGLGMAGGGKIMSAAADAILNRKPKDTVDDTTTEASLLASAQTEQQRMNEVNTFKQSIVDDLVQQGFPEELIARDSIFAKKLTNLHKIAGTQDITKQTSDAVKQFIARNKPFLDARDAAIAAGQEEAAAVDAMHKQAVAADMASKDKERRSFLTSTNNPSFAKFNSLTDEQLKEKLAVVQGELDEQGIEPSKYLDSDRQQITTPEGITYWSNGKVNPQYDKQLEAHKAKSKELNNHLDTLSLIRDRRHFDKVVKPLADKLQAKLSKDELKALSKESYDKYLAPQKDDPYLKNPPSIEEQQNARDTIAAIDHIFGKQEAPKKPNAADIAKNKQAAAKAQQDARAAMRQEVRTLPRLSTESVVEWSRRKTTLLNELQAKFDAEDEAIKQQQKASGKKGKPTPVATEETLDEFTSPAGIEHTEGVPFPDVVTEDDVSNDDNLDMFRAAPVKKPAPVTRPAVNKAPSRMEIGDHVDTILKDFSGLPPKDHLEKLVKNGSPVEKAAAEELIKSEQFYVPEAGITTKLEMNYSFEEDKGFQEAISVEHKSKSDVAALWNNKDKVNPIVEYIKQNKDSVPKGVKPHEAIPFLVGKFKKQLQALVDAKSESMSDAGRKTLSDKILSELRDAEKDAATKGVVKLASRSTGLKNIEKEFADVEEENIKTREKEVDEDSNEDEDSVKFDSDDEADEAVAEGQRKAKEDFEKEKANVSGRKTADSQSDDMEKRDDTDDSNQWGEHAKIEKVVKDSEGRAIEQTEGFQVSKSDAEVSLENAVEFDVVQKKTVATPIRGNTLNAKLKQQLIDIITNRVLPKTAVLTYDSAFALYTDGELDVDNISYESADDLPDGINGVVSVSITDKTGKVHTIRVLGLHQLRNMYDYARTKVGETKDVSFDEPTPQDRIKSQRLIDINAANIDDALGDKIRSEYQPFSITAFIKNGALVTHKWLEYIISSTIKKRMGELPKILFQEFRYGNATEESYLDSPIVVEGETVDKLIEKIAALEAGKKPFDVNKTKVNYNELNEKGESVIRSDVSKTAFVKAMDALIDSVKTISAQDKYNAKAALRETAKGLVISDSSVFKELKKEFIAKHVVEASIDTFTSNAHRLLYETTRFDVGAPKKEGNKWIEPQYRMPSYKEYYNYMVDMLDEYEKAGIITDEQYKEFASRMGKNSIQGYLSYKWNGLHNLRTFDSVSNELVSEENNGTYLNLKKEPWMYQYLENYVHQNIGPVIFPDNQMEDDFSDAEKEKQTLVAKHVMKILDYVLDVYPKELTNRDMSFFIQALEDPSKLLKLLAAARNNESDPYNDRGSKNYSDMSEFPISTELKDAMMSLFEEDMVYGNRIAQEIFSLEKMITKMGEFEQIDSLLDLPSKLSNIINSLRTKGLANKTYKAIINSDYVEATINKAVDRYYKLNDAYLDDALSESQEEEHYYLKTYLNALKSAKMLDKKKFGKLTDLEKARPEAQSTPANKTVADYEKVSDDIAAKAAAVLKAYRTNDFAALVANFPSFTMPMEMDIVYNRGKQYATQDMGRNVMREDIQTSIGDRLNDRSAAGRVFHKTSTQEVYFGLDENGKLVIKAVPEKGGESKKVTAEKDGKKFTYDKSEGKEATTYQLLKFIQELGVKGGFLSEENVEKLGNVLTEFKELNAKRKANKNEKNKFKGDAVSFNLVTTLKENQEDALISGVSLEDSYNQSRGKEYPLKGLDELKRYAATRPNNTVFVKRIRRQKDAYGKDVLNKEGKNVYIVDIVKMRVKQSDVKSSSPDKHGHIKDSLNGTVVASYVDNVYQANTKGEEATIIFDRAGTMPKWVAKKDWNGKYVTDVEGDIVRVADKTVPLNAKDLGKNYIVEKLGGIPIEQLTDEDSFAIKTGITESRKGYSGASKKLMDKYNLSPEDKIITPYNASTVYELIRILNPDLIDKYNVSVGEEGFIFGEGVNETNAYRELVDAADNLNHLIAARLMAERVKNAEFFENVIDAFGVLGEQVKEMGISKALLGYLYDQALGDPMLFKNLITRYGEGWARAKIVENAKNGTFQYTQQYQLDKAKKREDFVMKQVVNPSDVAEGEVEGTQYKHQGERDGYSTLPERQRAQERQIIERTVSAFMFAKYNQDGSVLSAKDAGKLARLLLGVGETENTKTLETFRGASLSWTAKQIEEWNAKANKELGIDPEEEMFDVNHDDISLMSDLYNFYRNEIAGETKLGTLTSTPENIHSLEPHQVFVFGSNTKGIHGKGAALDALKFGAKRGTASGLVGQTYGIITKDLAKGEKSVSLTEISKQISKLIEVAKKLPGKEFLVTKLGTKEAGYSVAEIAKIFRSKEFPPNVILPIEFQKEGAAEAKTSEATILDKHGQQVTVDNIFKREVPSPSHKFVLNAMIDMLAKRIGLTKDQAKELAAKSQSGSFLNMNANSLFHGVAKMFGAELVVVNIPMDGKAAMGGAMIVRKDGKRYIAINASRNRAMSTLVGHEVFHSIWDQLSAEERDGLRKVLSETKGYEDALNAYKQRMKLSDALDVDEEVLADIFAEILFTNEFQEKLQEATGKKTFEDSIFKKIYTTLVKTLEKLIEHLSSYFNKQDKAIFENFMVINDLQMVMEQLALVSGNVAKINTPVEIEVKTVQAREGRQTLVDKTKKDSEKADSDYVYRADAIRRMNKYILRKAKGEIVVDENEPLAGARALRDKAAEAAMKKMKQQTSEDTLYAKIIEKWTAFKNMFFSKFLSGTGVSMQEKSYVARIKNLPSMFVDKLERMKLHKYKRQFAIMSDVDWLKFHDRLRAKDYGAMTDWQREFLAVAKDITDAQFEKVKEYMPGLTYNPEHYGMFLQFRNPDQVANTQNLDYLFQNGDSSQLEGNKGWEKMRGEELPSSRVEKGAVLDIMNPYDVLRNYLIQTEKFVVTQQQIQKAIEQGDAYVLEKGALIRKGFAYLSDNASKMVNQVTALEFTGMDNKEKKFVGYVLVNSEGEVISPRYPNHPMAINAAKKLGQDGVKVKKIAKDIHNMETEVGRVVFKEGMARMLNNYLSIDHIRRSKVGRALLGFKNFTTAIELGWSMFHYNVINEEFLSSMQAYGFMKGGFTGAATESMAMNVVRMLPFMKGAIGEGAFKRAFELNRIMDKSIADPSSLNGIAHENQLRELFGDASTDIIQITKLLGEAGLQRKMDDSLRVVRDEIVYGKGFFGSVKDAFDKTMVDAEGHKLKYAIGGLKALELANASATNWLFDHYIPALSNAMAAWELSLWLSKNTNATEDEKLAAAIETVNSIQKRFGEMNWDNLDNNRTLNSALKLFFRSFTWQFGNWGQLLGGAKSVTKDYTWLYIKKAFGKHPAKIEMTHDGVWFISAMMTHMFTVMIAQSVLAMFGITGDDEKEKKSWLTNRMTVYIGNQERIKVPSYPTKFVEIGDKLHMAWMMKDPTYLAKLFTGGMSGFTNTLQALYTNKTNSNTYVYDPMEESILNNGWDIGKFMFLSHLPISFQSWTKERNAGNDIMASSLMAFAGATKAGAGDMYTPTERLAFSMGYKGTPTSEDKFKFRQDLKRAAEDYKRGDTTKMERMKAEGSLSRADEKEIQDRAKQDRLFLESKNLSLEKYIKIQERLIADGYAGTEKYNKFVQYGRQKYLKLLGSKETSKNEREKYVALGKKAGYA